MKDDLDPYDITSKLKVQPDDAHKSGDPHIGKTGRVFSPFREGFWSISSQALETDSVSIHIENLLQRLEDRESELIDLFDKGYYMDFFIGIFGIDGNLEIEVNHDLMLKLSRLHIDLLYDLYTL